ncbi:hypothetical protein V1264_001853 [Littorina saxatilis]|uniref:Ig-like domain-containing protein n=1 Tax=Littorina saxatilis TaxID=31220 RepID=A0AAN9C0C6_9CAEN
MLHRYHSTKMEGSSSSILGFLYVFCSHGVLGLDHVGTNIKTRPGQIAVLPCIVTDLGSRQVLWAKTVSTERQEILSIGHFVWTTNPRLSVEHDGDTQWNLVIDDVREGDAGAYTCQVASDDATRTGVAAVQLEVSWEEDRSRVAAKAGETAVLPCTFRYLGNKQVVWQRTGTKIQILAVGVYVFTSDARIHVQHRGKQWNLVINDVTEGDDGQYECRTSENIPTIITVDLAVAETAAGLDE